MIVKVFNPDFSNFVPKLICSVLFDYFRHMFNFPRTIFTLKSSKRIELSLFKLRIKICIQIMFNVILSFDMIWSVLWSFLYISIWAFPVHIIYFQYKIKTYLKSNRMKIHYVSLWSFLITIFLNIIIPFYSSLIIIFHLGDHFPIPYFILTGSLPFNLLSSLILNK